MTPKTALLALFILTGCANFPDADLQRVTAPSLGTTWTEANVRYNKTQRQAVEYAQRCDKDHSLFLSDCRDVVDDLYDYDQLALQIQQEGYTAVGRQDSDRLSELVRDLDEVAYQMKKLMPQETIR